MSSLALYQFQDSIRQRQNPPKNVQGFKKQISRAKKDQQEFNRHSERRIQKYGKHPTKI
jgi:hypothetical protein